MKANDWQTHDPEAAREAATYENPIPSRELILLHLAERGAPATRHELIEEFDLHDEQALEALRRRLRAMERDGQLIYTRRGAYALVDKLDLIRGTVSGHREGYGFLIPDAGGDDFYLSQTQMRLVFDGDRVLVRASGFDRRGRREATIVEVIDRAHETIVGRYFEESGLGVVVADNPKIPQEILVPPGKAAKARHNQFVQVRIEQWPTLYRQAQGEVVEVLGDYMAPGMEVEVALRSYGIPHVWPKAVERQAARLSPEVAEKDKQQRVDLRALPFVTIDGEDARDFDDAVYAEAKKGGGWRLYVAIADVSYYVKVASPLDEEARKRGNSVYFPQRVIPMLPEALSNGLCSLNPQADRLAMVCEVQLNRAGKMTGYRFYEAVIYSHARLTYTKVSHLLERPDDPQTQILRDQYAELLPHLQQLYALYKALEKARQARGAIDFETQETRIVFGADGKIVDIQPTQRNDAHKLIEECMLCANVATADFLQSLQIPALYRVHDGPTEDKLKNLRQFLGELGLTLNRGKGKPTPRDYQVVLEQIQGRPDFALIQTVMLRSLSQALYQPENCGHFGLNYPAYTHFTSPIRRYPDLLVHRAIRSVIRSRRATEKVLRTGAASLPLARVYPYDEPQLDQLGEHCSMTERRADEATRDVTNWLKCEYMLDRVGETFPGVITGVTGFGLFVELTDIFVEGLVHVTALPGDYYQFDAVHHRLIGERSGRVFRLGDTTEVVVVRVDLDERKIDFELAENVLTALSGRRKKATDSPLKTSPQSARTARGKRPAGKVQALTNGDPAWTESTENTEADTKARKSRTVKKALMQETAGKKAKKTAAKPSAARGSQKAQKSVKASAGAGKSKQRKDPAKPVNAGGKVRKRKAKS